MAVDESQLGIAFHTKKLLPKEQFQPAVWEAFKQSRLMAYGGHGH